MKPAGLLALTIPELRKLTGAQFLRIWEGCSSYSRAKIYLHIVLLMACASVIFNTAMRLTEDWKVDLLGLVVGLLVPPNVYFHFLFKDRRPAIRQFIEQNWEEFRPEQ